MGEIEWAMWANEQGLLSGAIILIGGIVGVAGSFHNWEFAAFSIAAAVLLMFLEYPRSRRKKGNTTERKFQAVLVPVVNALGPVTKNYYARSIIHLILCVPCCFILPTVLGGMCSMITAVIYLVAAVKGEEWRAIAHDKAQSQYQSAAQSVTEPPCKPPPRVPPQDKTVTHSQAEASFSQI